MAAARTAANVIGKGLTGRRRPYVDVPGHRRRGGAGEVVTAESGFVHGKHPHALVVYRKADG
jgi:hypothetical protein